MGEISVASPQREPRRTAPLRSRLGTEESRASGGGCCHALTVCRNSSTRASATYGCSHGESVVSMNPLYGMSAASRPAAAPVSRGRRNATATRGNNAYWIEHTSAADRKSGVEGKRGDL